MGTFEIIWRLFVLTFRFISFIFFLNHDHCVTEIRGNAE